MNTPTSLTSAVTLLTGAAAGIGEATARALARRGAVLVLLDRDPRVETLATELGADALVVDLAERDGAARAVADVVATHGRLDVLVNNAGLGRHNPIPLIRDDDLDLMWAVNVRALIILTREAFGVMDGRGGQIVNVVSTAGLRGGAGEAAYCATKFAVRGFTQSAADEGRLAGIRVHGIYPAGVDTAFWPAATASGPGVDPEKAFLRADDVATAIVHALESPAHVHLPEVVVRALGDGDLDAIATKLERFRQ